jgi:cyclopropane fatty-acyl-phospholipid synthase-like methyltransferase
MAEHPDLVRDRHILYEASVQGVESDAEFFERVYRRRNGSYPKLLREDFCGTAALACEWVKRGKDRHAWGVDLHQPTLEWGMQNRVPYIGAAADRLTLVNDDVLKVKTPKVDILNALNFSYSVFKDRKTLCDYFRHARQALQPGGLFILDVFGGTDAMDTVREERKVSDELAPDGRKIPTFTYIWQQARFNPVNHDILCYIHFKLSDKTKIKRAFRYDWRLWTLPELAELMLEAGFKTADTYVEGWDHDNDDSDGVYRLRRRFKNQAGWIAYLVGGL